MLSSPFQDYSIPNKKPDQGRDRPTIKSDKIIRDVELSTETLTLLSFATDPLLADSPIQKLKMQRLKEFVNIITKSKEGEELLGGFSLVEHFLGKIPSAAKTRNLQANEIEIPEFRFDLNTGNLRSQFWVRDTDRILTYL